GIDLGHLTKLQLEPLTGIAGEIVKYATADRLDAATAVRLVQREIVDGPMRCQQNAVSRRSCGRTLGGREGYCHGQNDQRQESRIQKRIHDLWPHSRSGAVGGP